MRRCESLLELLEARIIAERVCQAARVIHQFDQWSSFDGYGRTAEFLVEQFQAAGVQDVERIAIPCDGRFAFGDWIMPWAWDAREGTLELLDRRGRRERLLADYRAVPNHLVRWSGPTADGGEVFDLVYLPDASMDQHWQSAGVGGKFVFTHTAARAAYAFAARHGAAGVVTDFSPHAEQCPDRVHWENVWGSLPLWGPIRDDKPLPGFVLSPRQGKDLARRLKEARGPVRVRALVRSRLYEGSTEVITAALPGADRPQDEIVVYAHTCECQLDDNALGVAACLEMARVARDLIDAGLVPRPRRTLRFVVGWEWVGSTYYAMYHRQGRRWLASLCLDAVCTRQDLAGQPFNLFLSPTFASSFADSLYVGLWKAYASRRLSDRAWRTCPWSAGTDTYWIDPHLGGVSNVLAEQGMGPTWHKSHTHAGQVDVALLQGVGVVSLAWLLSIAGAGQEEARHFARLAADRVERRVRSCACGFDFSRPDVQAARQQFDRQMGYLRQAARRVIDTSVLAPDDARLGDDIDALARRVEGAIDQETAAAAGRFDAAARDMPAWQAGRPLDHARDRDERVADNMVPTRCVQGYLWTLHRMEPERRRVFQSHGRLEPLPLFLTDGKRSLLEIVQRSEFERGGPLNLKNLIRQFRMLEEAGYVRLEYRRTFDLSRILEDLAAMGVHPGDTLLVHASLRSLGPIQGGPETFLQALEQAVGPAGTVCIPAFAFNTVGGRSDPFDVRTTPSRVGKLSDLFWRQPGALRSEHPGHGLAAKGPAAERIVADGLARPAFDLCGPFGELYRLNAKILFVGCGLAPNSTLHAVEDWANLPSMQPTTYHYVGSDGRPHEITFDKAPLHGREFYSLQANACERMLYQEGLVHEGQVALARAFLMPLRGVVEMGLGLLRDGSFGFLFGDGNSSPAVRDIMDALRTRWSFPQDILDRLQALRG